MSSSENEYEHSRPTEAPAGPPAPEPSYAERARTLVHLGRVGTLASASARHPGWPFGSVMPYGLDRLGRPSFLISSMAMHTQNLRADPRASLLVMESAASEDPLGAGRVTLMGEIREVAGSDVSAVRESYLAAHPNASYWVDFKDFSFFRMELLEVYFVGGFGVMGWVAADDFSEAEPDPLADAAAGILSHMNADHRDAMALLVQAATSLESDEVKMTSVDRLGFHLRVTTGEAVKGMRLPFLREVRSAEEARRVLVEMVRLAREKHPSADSSR